MILQLHTCNFLCSDQRLLIGQNPLNNQSQSMSCRARETSNSTFMSLKVSVTIVSVLMSPSS